MLASLPDGTTLAGLMRCAACGPRTSPGGSSAASAAAPLAAPAPRAAAPNPSGVKFCGECGRALGVAARRRRRRAAPGRRAEARLGAVRRPGRVHGAVGGRDAEDTRELLSRYFDTCRRLIELYGGTVEKFIGDAVMAVWGTPTATEDDAERAVRAALDLVAAVSALGDEVGAPELRARAGVLTGEAAVTIGAEGAGDGRGRSRQHRLADPVGGRAGHGARRRGDPAGDRADGRLRGRGRPRAEGQGGARRRSGGRCASSRAPAAR